MKRIQGKTFNKEKAIKWEEVEVGISRQFFGFNLQLMMVKFKFQKGAIGYVHNHFHSQATYLASGKFKITIDGRSEILEKGDGFFVNPNLKHEAECLEAGILIDIFNPLREDFL